MPKKPNEPQKAKRWRKPRAARKDERGIALTSDQRPLAFLPSDFAHAMRQPPEAPTEAMLKAEPEKPVTVIPELNAIESTPFAYQTVIEAIEAADKVQIERMNPTRRPFCRSCNTSFRGDGPYACLLVARADELVGCTENSPEERELEALTDTIEAYERLPGAKG